MTVFDASARPMWNAFANKADTRPFESVAARHALDERNPQKQTADARRSGEFDLEEADRIDDDEMNAILWHAVKNSEPPAPVRSFWGR
jgi:hypothetical protein